MAPASVEPPRRCRHPLRPGLVDLAALTAPELAQRADVALRWAHQPTWAIIADHWHGCRAELLSGGGLGPTLEERRAGAELDYLVVWSARRIDQTVAWYAASAAAAYRSLGDNAEALLVDQLQAARNADADGVRRLADEVEAAEGTVGQRSRALLRVATTAGGRTSALAAEEIERALTAAPPLDHRTRAVAAGAQLYLATGDSRSIIARAENALSILEVGEHVDVRCQALIQRARGHRALRQTREAAAALKQAEREAYTAGAAAIWARVLLERAELLPADQALFERRIRRAAAALGRVPEPVGGMLARARLARVLIDQGRADEADEVLREGMGEVAAPDATVVEQRALAGRRAELAQVGALAAHAAGDQARAVVLIRQAVEWFTEAGELANRAQALCQAATLIGADHPAPVVRALDLAMDDAVVTQDYRLQLLLAAQRVWPRLLAAGTEAALADVDHALLLGERLQAIVVVDDVVRRQLSSWDFTGEPGRLAVLRARVLAASQRTVEAAAVLASVPEQMVEIGRVMDSLEARFLRGRLHLANGDSEQGLTDLDRVRADAEQIGAQAVAQQAVAAAAGWLDSQSRSYEADAWWQSFGGPARAAPTRVPWSEEST